MENYSDKAALADAMQSLHRYIRAMYISVDEKIIDEPIVKEYFETSSAERKVELEKIMAAATVRSVFADPEIPICHKGNVARRAAAEIVEAFSAAKIDYEYCSGKMGTGLAAQRQYEKLKKANKLAQRAAGLRRIVNNIPVTLSKMAAKEGVKAGLAALGMAVGSAGGPAGALVGFLTGLAVDVVIAFTPQSVKDKVQARAEELAEKAANVVANVGRKLMEVEPIRKTVEYVNTEIIPVVKKTVTIVKDKLRVGWKKLKAAFA